MKEQNGLCAICGKPETRRGQNGTLMGLSADHNHATGARRKLLCKRCNIMLACESPGILAAGAKYLMEHMC